MEPQIRYVQSADGTRIATWSLGQGRPLVYLTYWFYTIELVSHIPEVLANLQRLAEKRTVVMYDARGTGLSSREVTDLSLDARVADLEAVVASLGQARIDLQAGARAAPVAIRYAARHAEKVNKLVLTNPLASVWADERLQLLEPLAEVDWQLYLQCRGLVLFGWTDLGRRVAEQQAREVSGDVHAMITAASSQDDVTSLLPLVRCPTLVMVRRGRSVGRSQDASKDLAAALPNARLVHFQQDEVMILAGAWDSTLRIAAEFLDEGELAEESQLPHGTAIILFADIADSTALTERLGDAAFREKARELDAALRRAITDAGGTAIEGKLLGDGVLATFGAAREAIGCAAACHAAGSQAGLPLHVGIHAGDVIREKGNVYGGAVNIASRVAGEAAASETLVSATVRDLARTSAGVTFEDRGERTLKGVGEPVRVFAVHTKEQGTGNKEQG